MRVTVIGVEKREQHILVTFECECGVGGAFWMGDQPATAAEAHVELEIEETMTVGQNLVPCEEPKGIRMVGEETSIVGSPVDVESDGFFRLDFGCGSVNLGYSGVPPAVDRRYRIVTGQVKAYDCGY